MSTTLSKVFNLFCDTNDLRPELKSPFIINGRVYATDAKILIRCNKSDCDFEITNTYSPSNIESVIPPQLKNEILNIDKSVFEKFKTKDEYKYAGKDVYCKTCNGEGLVEWKFEIYEKESDCPVCDGSGYEVRKKKVKTGEKIFGEYNVKLNKHYFDMSLFYKLIEVQNYLGGDIVLLHQSNQSNGALFKVGFCEILIARLHQQGVYNDNQILDLNQTT